VATDGIREGEVGCLSDEIQDLVGPTERRTMDGPAGPQRGRMPERRGGLARLTRPCRASASTHERPGQTKECAGLLWIAGV
jgi:hypothetical protein